MTSYNSFFGGQGQIFFLVEKSTLKLTILTIFKMYSSVSLSTFTLLWNLSSEFFQVAQLQLRTHLAVTPGTQLPSAPGNHHLQSVLLWPAYFICIMSWKFIHAVACVRSCILFKANIPLYVYTAFCLLVDPRVGICVASTSWLLWMVYNSFQIFSMPLM